MTEQRRLECCRDCHWWKPDGDRQEAKQGSCRGLDPGRLNADSGTNPVPAWFSTRADYFCPKFARWDGGRVFRPGLCSGCAAAAQTLRNIEALFRSDSFDAREMVVAEDYESREEARQRLLADMQKYRKWLYEATFDS
jgi:hypothetical protein